MTADEKLTADIKRHLRLCDELGTIPNVLYLATKNGVTVAEVEERLRAITTNAPKGLG